MSPEHRRLTHALLLSLLIHALLWSLTFGGQGLWLTGFGFTGFGFPWQDRRIEPDLRVVVVPAQSSAAEPPVAEPLQRPGAEQPVATGPTLTSSVSPVPVPRPTAAAIV